MHIVEVGQRGGWLLGGIEMHHFSQHCCEQTSVLLLLCCVSTLHAQGFRIAGKQGIGIIAACQAVLMGGPEYARWVDAV